MSELPKRIITGIVGIILLLFFLLKGGYFLYLLVFMLGIFCVYELSRAFQPERKDFLSLNILATILSFIAFYFSFPPGITIFLTYIPLFIYFLFHTETDMKVLMQSVFILSYIPFFLFPMIYLDQTPYLFLVFILAFSTDTMAYAVGITMGKHKLMPKVSPKKSIEGSIGGLLGAMIGGTIYYHFKSLDINFYVILFFLLTSIMGQIGDLFASRIKRSVGIKDYGHILPGHGGIMDRFDSILFIIPVIYCMYTFL